MIGNGTTFPATDMMLQRKLCVQMRGWIFWGLTGRDRRDAIGRGSLNRMSSCRPSGATDSSNAVDI